MKRNLLILCLNLQFPKSEDLQPKSKKGQITYQDHTNRSTRDTKWSAYKSDIFQFFNLLQPYHLTESALTGIQLYPLIFCCIKRVPLSSIPALYVRESTAIFSRSGSEILNHRFFAVCYNKYISNLNDYSFFTFSLQTPQILQDSIGQGGEVLP